MNTGYSEAIRLASEKLKTLNAQEVCASRGAVLSNDNFLIPWFGENRPIESGSQVEKVLWLHYLTSGTSAPLADKLIAFRELPSALFYEPKFSARAERPLVKRFGGAPEDLVAAGLKLGGKATPHGDAAVTLHLLPRIPVTYILWAGDEEIPPECKILFDASAPKYLPAEDLTVLASLGAYKLIKS